LLKHEFGDENGIGVTGATPGEIATVVAIPIKQGGTKELLVSKCIQTGQRSTLNAQRSTLNSEMSALR
jgi:hypothetical protein